MKSVPIICEVALAFAVAVGTVEYHRGRPIFALSPAAQYAIPGEQLAAMRARAEANDCGAINALAEHYLNVALDFDAGLKWSRAGAHCPGIRPKERLVGLLAQVPPSKDSAREIEQWINEIQGISPLDAERIARSVQ
jgi:hypothetical protein